MRTLLYLLWITASSSAFAQWQLSSSTKPTTLGHGAWQVTKQVSGPIKVELHLIYFKASDCILRVVDQPQKDSAEKMNAIASKGAALAICNGGYYSPDDFTPSGLQVSGGKRSGTFQKNMPFGGGFMVKAGRPMLYVDSEFVEAKDITELVQCCPMLVNDGKPLSEKGGGPLARRTFILTDGAGYWALGIANRAGLRELADILTTPEVITEFKVVRALNLDGGPSTGLWWRNDQGVATYHKEMWPVKNLIMVLSRP